MSDCVSLTARLMKTNKELLLFENQQLDEITDSVIAARKLYFEHAENALDKTKARDEGMWNQLSYGTAAAGIVIGSALLISPLAGASWIGSALLGAGACTMTKLGLEKLDVDPKFTGALSVVATSVCLSGLGATYAAYGTDFLKGQFKDLAMGFGQVTVALSAFDQSLFDSESLRLSAEENRLEKKATNQGFFQEEVMADASNLCKRMTAGMDICSKLIEEDSKAKASLTEILG